MVFFVFNEVMWQVIVHSFCWYWWNVCQSLFKLSFHKAIFIYTSALNFRHTIFNHISRFKWFKGPSWPWSYGSWIYNYLCNRCLSPLMLWVRISIRRRCTTLCDKVCQWLAAGPWFSTGIRFPPPIKTNRTM